MGVMTDRVSALRSLGLGDIFHARSPNGASLVCLVTAVSETTIFARGITTQDDVQFDRHTGSEPESAQSRIDCVVPFSPEIHAVFLDMDRKYQEFRRMYENGSPPDIEQYKLTDPEKRALLFIAAHVSSNPI